MFKYSRKNSTLRGKLMLDPLDVIATDSFQNLLGVLINVVLYVRSTTGIFPERFNIIILIIIIIIIIIQFI